MSSVCGNYTYYYALYEPYAESHIRLAYIGDGEYVLRFTLRESGWDTDIVKIFELSLNIAWPETPKLMTVAYIERQPDERKNIGYFEVAVGAETISFPYYRYKYQRSL